ncbi:MAG: immunoglobulin domain-containing protein [Phycisphaerales bacterium]|nr:immunoglobulin domain-containing protein [Phycisphaerales bacterium]
MNSLDCVVTSIGRPVHPILTSASIGISLALCGLAQGQVYEPPPNANIVLVTTFGATPNDGTDDLAAFQNALNATVGTSRILFVPNGTYNFSGRLNWGGIGSGGFFTLQGESKSGVVLRLNDGAAGFGSTASPLAFIDAYEGNTANQFRNYLRDVTIDIGSNNPGAIGLEFQANNTGRIENVTIRSSDPLKRGHTGLNQGFNFPGPLLIRNLTIDGFDTGYVGAPQEYSVVFENLTLLNQRTEGIYVWRLPLQIRNLVSTNTVPVLRSDSNPGAWGHVVIDGATLHGGSPTGDAIINENSGGVLILRNVTTSGYANAVRDKSFSTTTPTLVPGGVVSQFTTDAPASINPSPTAVLNLPIEETPSAPSIPVAQWVSIKSFGAIENDNLDDTDAVQAAMNSGAPVVYFPSGRYYVSRTIRVGPSVQRVEGLMSDIVTNAPLATEGGPLFLVPPGSQSIVHFSGINGAFSGPGANTGYLIGQATANTVVVRDGDISYRNSVSGGKLFLENVVGSNMVFKGQRVWARQLNPEGSGPPLIINDAGDFYVLGLKTEGSSIVLENRNRARATIMGGLVYPATAISDRAQPMVINNESSLSWSMPESAYVDPNNAYAIWVRETRNGVTTNFTRAMLPLGRGHSDLGGQIALYNGYQIDATAPSVPAPTISSTTRSSIQLSWPASTDAQSGIARYNIYRNGAFYRAATTNSLLDDALPDATNFSYRVSAVNGGGVESAQSAPLNAATLTDSVAPRLASVRVGLDARVIVLTFSEPLAQGPATTPANYVITGPSGVSVTGAALSGDATVVTLTTTPMSPGTHEIVLSGLTDRATNPSAIAPSTRASFSYSSTTAGTGMTARYFNNRDFIGSPVLTRVDPVVNFNYGLGSPDPLVNADNFSARWTGRIQPRYSETYTFFTRSDDGSRLFIDGLPVVTNWFDQGATERSGTVTLDSSRTYEVTLEYYDSGFGAEVQFSWQSASQPKQIVPQTCLYPDSNLITIRTSQGAGADIDLNRFFPGPGTGDSMGAFHSPAQGGFHQAAYWRLDLSSLDLTNNYITTAVGSLSQTFFGIGDGKRQINIFGVRQSANGDNWVESGPGFVTWQTAVGNDDSGGLANPATSQFLSTYLLDNTGFQNNNQSDKLTFGGQRLMDFINQDTDSRLTFIAKRVDASNEGQSWFTKEWSQPTMAPAIKVILAPRCPQIVTQPVASVSYVTGMNCGIYNIVARGAPTLSYQWRRNNVPLIDGPTGAGSFIAGANSSALSITNIQPQDAGDYTVVVSNACGSATSAAAAISVVTPPDPRCNPADIAYDDGAALPPVGISGGTNNGVTEGDYNLFFATFFDAGAACDIANDDGSPLPPFGTLETNNGVTEGDYNLFFAIYFNGCAF